MAHRRSRTAAPARAMVTVSAMMLVMAGAAGGAQAQGTTTTSSTTTGSTTTTSSTTTTGSTTTTTIGDGSTTTGSSSSTTPTTSAATTTLEPGSSVALDPDDPNATTTSDPLAAEAPGESVPETEETVPSRGSYAGQKAYEAPEVLWSSVETAEAKLNEAQARVETAVAAVRADRARHKRLELRRQTLGDEIQVAISELAEAERVLAERSVAAFVGSEIDGGAMISALQATDHEHYESLWVRDELLDAALEQDDLALDRYRRLRERLDGSVWATIDALRRVERRIESGRSAFDDAIAEREQAQIEYDAFAAGSAIYISGARFPIAEPYNTPLIDSFGFPRMTGTPDEHWHEGIDLFAPAGTPLLAAERGVITRINNGRLGGLTFWLKGESGAHWYYAHLLAYIDGLAVGQVVEAGQVLGFVGNTGNAVGTPPHLHLQLHPGGGDPINPYPLLKVLSDRELAASEAARNEAIGDDPTGDEEDAADGDGADGEDGGGTTSGDGSVPVETTIPPGGSVPPPPESEIDPSPDETTSTTVAGAVGGTTG